MQELALNEDGSINKNYQPLQDSAYVVPLKFWQNVFPKEQLHIVDGDQLLVNPLPELKLLESFLGIEHKITKDMIYFDEEKGFLCMIKNGEKFCLSNEKGHEQPDVDERVSEKLRHFFKPLNERFYRSVNRSFDW